MWPLGSRGLNDATHDLPHLWMSGLGDVEAHEFRCGLRDAEHIAWSKNDALLKGRPGDFGRVQSAGKTAPEVEAPARRVPNLKSEGLQLASRLPASPHKTQPQILHVLAIPTGW